MAGAVPVIIGSVRDQLVEIIEERFAHFAATQPPQTGPCGFQNHDLTDCKPPEFHGGVVPIKSMRWLADVEGAFLTSNFPDNRKITLEMNL